MSDDLFARLQRLGLAKGARHLKPAPPPPAREPESRPPVDRSLWADAGAPPPLDVLLPGGRLEESPGGAVFVVDRVYPLSHRHGEDALHDLLAYAPAPLAALGEDRRLEGLNFRDLVFLDTETTGLAGAGALAFMVGVAYFDRQPSGDGATEAFVVRQFFLRDHGDEVAMLLQLDDLIERKAGLITFNGRAFDLPLLDTRYLMNRMRGHVLDVPHLDLLPPSRRLYRARVGSCALGSLERSLLGLHRTEEDVPGWLIPALYLDYLRTRDARPLTRVFYHNQMDMLSMVTLATRIARQVSAPGTGDHALDRLSLARWQADRGMTAEAENGLLAALAADLPYEVYQVALSRLAQLYRQGGRREDAVRVWRQMAATSYDSVEAHVELAKHFEWHAADLREAMRWTEAALALLDRQRYTAPTGQSRAEVAHRYERLRRKLNATQTAPTE